MVYFFNDFEFDLKKLELRKSGALVALEPQVFNLLKLLVVQRDRAVSKDELVEDVWHGRIVSDAAIASRIRLVRQALGDSGAEQHSIRTVHGYGFRFVADVLPHPDAIAPKVADQLERPALQEASPQSLDEANLNPSENIKPSIVVLPFHLVGSASDNEVIADGFSHDLIQALSRVHWLFVIARGTAFKFRSAVPDTQEIGKILGVRYCLAGRVELSGQTIMISLELSDTRDGGVVWGEQFHSAIEGVHEIRAEIVARIVSSLEIQIPLHEAHDARLNVSENLDAWSIYHLALQHMFRFTREDNSKATALFERAVLLDPGFARAFAGLSFTHFQDAFLMYNDAPKEAAQNARKFAERSLELDSLDPFANFTMGRYFWLEGELDTSLDWLDRSIELSPNYAQCIYSRAFTEMLLGNETEAHKSVENAILLSPLDPLRYGMLGVKSLSFLAEGDYENASIWGEKAARSQGAHYLISLIAAIGHTLNGNDEKARSWIEDARRRKPDASQDQFFNSFMFLKPKTRKQISNALERNGL